MSNCQDNYCVTFRNYPSLLLHQEEQATRSQWERRRVKDLWVEPLDKKAPLYSDLSSFARGVTRDAVEDTAKNPGLAMRMAEGCYPIRDTAYKSLLGRTKISGSALPKLKRDTLASVLPVNELLRALQNKLDERFPGSEFENGYCDHALVSASWSPPGQKDQPAARMHGPLGEIPYTVGGSDVAAIFGLSPWMTPLELWKIKKGQMKTPEKANSGQLEMGHLLEPIAAKLVLVDEVSMLDIYLANKLLDAMMLGSKLILISDADQLPSVGPWAVLSEMIASGCVPIVRLDKVFRQEAGSRIAANAKLIRDGYKTTERIKMSDVTDLLGLHGEDRNSFYVRCPCCDTEKGKHLNINLKKEVFRCARCGEAGGIFDLYALFTGTPREQARRAIIERIGVYQPQIRRNEPEVRPVENPLAPVAARHKTYMGFLSVLSLTDKRRANLRGRGLPADGMVASAEGRRDKRPDQTGRSLVAAAAGGPAGSQNRL